MYMCITIFYSYHIFESKIIVNKKEAPPHAISAQVCMFPDN